MRSLCLHLGEPQSSAVAENFLSFSPRVHYRQPGWIFADIASTAHLFGGEEQLLDEALNLALEFYPDASIAIADSPFAAQVFSRQPDMYIVPPTEEQGELNALPLQALNDLEGLIAWKSVKQIEEIIGFFQTLGLQQIGEIREFQIEAFRERWGETGTTLWRRLHGLDKQVISPLIPSDSLVDYVYLDFPVSLVSFLLHCLQKTLKGLFARLQGRREFMQKVQIHLYCEYSNKVHLIEIQPANPNRDLELVMKLIENRLVGLELENPIREFEVEVVSCAEKQQQFDFFAPRVRDTDKLQQLVSVFHQASVTTGYFKPQDEVLPEKSWQITPEFEAYEPLEDELDFADDTESIDGKSFRIKSSYGHHLQQAPRPNRLLERSRALNDHQVKQLHFLSHHPIERLEDSWWQDSRGRDYYIALSTMGQKLWVYRDRIEDRYYLQGYFD